MRMIVGILVRTVSTTCPAILSVCTMSSVNAVASSLIASCGNEATLVSTLTCPCCQQQMQVSMTQFVENARVLPLANPIPQIAAKQKPPVSTRFRTVYAAPKRQKVKETVGKMLDAGEVASGSDQGEKVEVVPKEAIADAEPVEKKACVPKPSCSTSRALVVKGPVPSTSCGSCGAVQPRSMVAFCTTCGAPMVAGIISV